MQGVLWSIMALGVYVTFRLLNFADMTCDGSFTLGAAVSAVWIDSGHSPFISLILAISAGAVAGLVTGFFNTRMKIPQLLAGILTQIALYSINLRVMGKSNIALLSVETLFTRFQTLLGIEENQSALLLGLIVVIAIIGLMYYFFGTEIGSMIRASGQNPGVVRALGCSTQRCTMIALVIGNALIACSGALVAQNQGYADIDMGPGTIVIGLAAIIIAEVIFPQRHFAITLTSVVIGSVLYRMIIALLLAIGLKTQDMKLCTALIVAFALYLPILKRKRIPGERKVASND
ncbi:MAG: ABC transporter permease [Eubacteriales bacterium]|nr:ABC transporter permease [Eubacteriales bacterium]